MKASPLNVDQIRRGLTARRLGSKLHYFRELDSTNTYARGLAQNGAAEGEIVIAEAQTHGRGRLGRTWFSPPFVNLYVSIILRPTLRPIDAPQITLAAAVSLVDAIAGFIPQKPVIKWPNDILVNGKKVAGILSESSCRSDYIDFVVLGIGVNVNFAPESVPETIRNSATSLCILNQRPVGREEFLRRLIHDLDRCYGILEERGFDAIAPEWKARFGLSNRPVRIEMSDGNLRGRALGIDRDGALLVETEAGAIERVIAGDVIPLQD